MEILKVSKKDVLSNKIAFLGLFVLVIIAMLLNAYNWRDSNLDSNSFLAKNASCVKTKKSYDLKLNLSEKSNLVFSGTGLSLKTCNYLKSEVSNNQTTARFLKGNRLITELSIGNEVIYEKSKSAAGLIFIACLVWSLLWLFFTLIQKKTQII